MTWHGLMTFLFRKRGTARKPPSASGDLSPQCLTTYGPHRGIPQFVSPCLMLIFHLLTANQWDRGPCVLCEPPIHHINKCGSPLVYQLFHLVSPLSSVICGSITVMDMVIFRTIFFELFSFLHVHDPYPPFRLLMNLRNSRDKTKTLFFVQPMIMVQQTRDKKCAILRATPPWTPTPPPLRPQPLARE